MQSIREKIKFYREEVKKAKSKIVDWNKSGVKGWFQVSIYTREIDNIIRRVLKEAFKEVSPSYSVVALGGYGRKELNLCSDLDIMFLWRTPLSQEEEDSLNTIIQIMWDLGLDVGHSYRSVDEALALASEDDATKCSYLDARLLGGSLNPYYVFMNRLKRQFLGKDPKVFYRIMDRWLEDRYGRYGSSMYLLEPNVKESPGCLRDLHTCYWIGRELYGVVEFADLKKKGLLTPLEYETLEEARDFLWRVRNVLHEKRGRKNDMLTIDLQPEVAYQLGYRDTRKLLGVEYFMKDFYNHVRHVKRVTKAFLLRTKEEFFEDVSVSLHPLRVLLEERFDKPADFLKEVVKLLKEGVDFEEFYKGFWVPPLHWRESSIYSEETRDAFVELLNQEHCYQALNFLHEIGFLERLIPEFGKITGLMQFDLYHKFTVDEHTLLSIKNVETLPSKEEPMYADLKRIYLGLYKSGKKYLLMLALLLHDIGKGKGGGHSARGARIAAEVLQHMKFSEEEIDLVTFLVRNHTVMSEFAFRRDISDTKTVTAFASIVGSVEKLDFLYVLTYSDVSAISPELWNEWKATLLHSLYLRTKELLENKSETKSVDPYSFRMLVGEIYRRLDKAFDIEKIEQVLKSIPEENLISLSPELLSVIVRGMEEAEQQGVAVAWCFEELEGLSKLVVVDKTEHGDASKAVGIISSRRLNIQSASLITCKTGCRIYVFEVTMLDFSPVKDQCLMKDVAEAVKKATLGEIDVDSEIRKRHVRLSKRDRVFHFETKVRLNNNILPTFSVIEVKTQDRVGLLYTLMKELRALGLEVHMAKVSTEGNRAVDTFYVTKNGQKIREYEFPEIVRRIKAALS
ncbi:[protein-PII] uridylyltransferase [Thermosulfidibacter takaii ABI70S6]|uniref:Bifunctional uridylyltransferase/uridylyl-removing enzyme n=1 Tax=Thermosulfidibacter takaii (strain DSM 17441 / JCM 13301 / NBRC 103674 / ABI70S6) TaxID=1298851 RepID=A0A0S3QRQ0_THET7|nr:HD domain-containing protein [Thermosulfidibacter takaii]BAT70997.1 [protein-PII] uridylyltransferase [Thermosulfidibacter takaii ABI70S6]